jgi:phosphate-selective porin
VIAALLALFAIQEPAKPALEAGYEEGFFIRGKDAKLTEEGLLQMNASVFERDGPHPSEFVLRRMRLEFSGEFFERWLFHLEPNFGAHEFEFEEAWLGFQAGDHRFMFGRMKEPFELEEMSSTRRIDPLERSILNQLVPQEDHGITVNGRFDLLEYGVGFYNGTGSEDTTSDKDAALRLVLHPCGCLQFGGAATVGRQKTDVSAEELRTEARVPWAEFVAGTEITGQRVRLGAEVAYLEGPVAVTAELLRIREALNGETVRLTGGYVMASVVLTGEEKTRHGVKPARPFLKEPDLGAWQVVARWSRLLLDDEMAPFLTNFPGRIDSITLGVNWYANEFVVAKVDYSRTMYDEPITIQGNTHRNEDAVLFQLQVMF